MFALSTSHTGTAASTKEIPSAYGRRGKPPTVNKLRARHPPETMVKRKREEIMEKKRVLTTFATCSKRRTMKTVQKNENRISAGIVKCRSKN
jgi:hypothetical protein